jgi:hypothetical protein
MARTNESTHRNSRSKFPWKSVIGASAFLGITGIVLNKMVNQSKKSKQSGQKFGQKSGNEKDSGDKYAMEDAKDDSENYTAL